MARLRYLALTVAALVGAPAATADAASVKRCSPDYAGLQRHAKLSVTEVRVRSLSCKIGRQVAREVRVARGQGRRVRTTIDGARWSCLTRYIATNSDGTVPGPSSTGIECRTVIPSRRLVRFELRS